MLIFYPVFCKFKTLYKIEMPDLFSNTALGYALISGVVLLAVGIYTIVKVRKQVRKTQEKEEKKKRHNLP